MGALPKRKLSNSRKGERRSHLHLVPQTLVECPSCHNPMLPHRVCPTCGKYRGRDVLQLEAGKKKG
ncbi:MAG: 50S ribosomal protein L32 [Dehalococcoidia bacterium]|nr:50S ribosomal protein L32 [Dehalococcoidia bacterium]